MAFISKLFNRKGTGQAPGDDVVAKMRNLYGVGDSGDPATRPGEGPSILETATPSGGGESARPSGIGGPGDRSAPAPTGNQDRAPEEAPPAGSESPFLRALAGGDPNAEGGDDDLSPDDASLFLEDGLRDLFEEESLADPRLKQLLGRVQPVDILDLTSELRSLARAIGADGGREPEAQ